MVVIRKHWVARQAEAMMHATFVHTSKELMTSSLHSPNSGNCKRQDVCRTRRAACSGQTGDSIRSEDASLGLGKRVEMRRKLP